MNQFYRSINLSKQAFHQHLNRYLLQMDEQQQLLPMIAQVRRDHPQLSSRMIYMMMQPQSMGRDRFERFCFNHGFKLERTRSFRRTTNSLGVTRFNNLLTGFALTSINQVFVSDITYYQIEQRFFYLTFIMDLYSRFIVGYSASSNLLTENTTMPALQMAITHRTIPDELILHSDGGGQYYSKDFLALTRKYLIRNSMCENVYENAHAERVNGTIKNDYLIHYAPNDLSQLKKMLRKAVYMYNNHRPHTALSALSPAQFERLLTEISVTNKRKKEAKKENDNNYNSKFTIPSKTVNAIQA